MCGRITQTVAWRGSARKLARIPGTRAVELEQQALEIDQRIALVDDPAPLGKAAAGVEPARPGIRVERVETNGVRGPALCDGDRVFEREPAQTLTLVGDGPTMPVRYSGRLTGVKYETSIAQGFFVASRSTVTMRFPSRPTRMRAWRSASVVPRSVASADHGPGPCRAVSAPAAALCRPAMAATSSGVASRNFTVPRAARGRFGRRVARDPPRGPPDSESAQPPRAIVAHTSTTPMASISRPLHHGCLPAWPPR